MDSVTFLARRANAYQAYYEHMPLRPSAMPRGPHMTLYRTISYGRLAEFQVLDTRQYRTDQPCGDGTKPPCDGVYDPKATLLGDVQEQWLGKQLQKSPATWNVFAQQIMMGRVDRAPVKWSLGVWINGRGMMLLASVYCKMCRNAKYGTLLCSRGYSFQLGQ